MIFSAKRFMSVFAVDYPKQLAYIWQASEYDVASALKWWTRIPNFKTFSRRGTLVTTQASRIVRGVIAIIVGAYAIVNVLSIIHVSDMFAVRLLHAIIAVLLYPIAVVIMSMVPIVVLKLAKKPIDTLKVKQAKTIYREHPGTVIAVAGSYGKTSMKELLVATLSVEKTVSATFGNKNTLNSQAQFVTQLTGQEDFVIVELGEGRPGDIAKMVDLIDPDYAVVTGLAPNHLDRYKTIEAVANDFEVLLQHVGVEKSYLNADSPELFRLLGTKGRNYSSDGFEGWVPIDTKLRVDSMASVIENCGKSFTLKTSLVGRHNIGPLLFALLFAEKLGVSRKLALKKLELLEPYEHRMKPRLINGAWLIDDTYNGNIEGMIAGLSYLQELKVEGRKLYATPGLVDQGIEAEKVHVRLGEAIAECNPDQVYLMKSSNTAIIEKSMINAGYNGNYTIVEDPLSFYLHVEDVLASGDVMLCQNDFPDQYQ